MALETGHGAIPEDVVVAEICERFGWTYEQYWDQPASFLEVIRVKMQVENEYREKEQKRAERASKRRR